MYLHGGGFKLGFVEDDRNITAELARRTGASVVAVEYALAPENRFPVVFDDCLSVYNGCWRPDTRPPRLCYWEYRRAGTSRLPPHLP